MRHYSHYIDVAHCKGSKIGHGTVVASVECEARNPLCDDALSLFLLSLERESKSAFWFFLHEQKERPVSPKHRKVLLVPYGTLDTAPALSSKTANEYQKLRSRQPQLCPAEQQQKNIKSCAPANFAFCIFNFALLLSPPYYKVRSLCRQ